MHSIKKYWEYLRVYLKNLLHPPTTHFKSWWGDPWIPVVSSVCCTEKPPKGVIRVFTSLVVISSEVTSYRMDSCCPCCLSSFRMTFKTSLTVSGLTWLPGSRIVFLESLTMKRGDWISILFPPMDPQTNERRSHDFVSKPWIGRGKRQERQTRKERG